MKRRMEESTTATIYDRFAAVYDYTFGPLVHRRQAHGIELLNLKPGDRVLDLGIGTGNTVDMYPRHIELVGIDLSYGMLTKAARKIHSLNTNWPLVQGDALRTPFPDASFDHIAITHVISVVSDAPGLLCEAARLLKPKGSIALVNHFQSKNKIVAWFEHVLNPLFTRIGWRSDLSLDECLEGVPLVIEHNTQLSYFDLWKIIVLKHAERAS